MIKWVCLKTRYSKIPSLITMFTSSDTPQMKLVCLIGRLRRPPWRVLTCGILWPQEDMRLPGGSFFFPIRNHWSLFQTLGIPGSSKDASSRVFCWRNWKITFLKKCQWTVWWFVDPSETFLINFYSCTGGPLSFVQSDWFLVVSGT